MNDFIRVPSVKALRDEVLIQHIRRKDLSLKPGDSLTMTTEFGYWIEMRVITDESMLSGVANQREFILPLNY